MFVSGQCLALPPLPLAFISLLLLFSSQLTLLPETPAGPGLSLLSFLKPLLVILWWDFSYVTLCYSHVCFLISPFWTSCWSQITIFCSPQRPLQYHAQFLKHNKHSIIHCLIELNSGKLFLLIMCGQNNYSKFTITVSSRARIWTREVCCTLPRSFTASTMERIAIGPPI